MQKSIEGALSSSGKLVFAFDVGTGSLGCAVRLDDEIVHSRVYRFDPEFASTLLHTQKRRLARTRLAHRAREYLLNQICAEAGIPILKQIEYAGGDYRVTQTDPRLKREFPARNDSTVYTSCLLRILLIEGKEAELEPWQIYKALYSAIQKRGYGPVPWARDSDNASKETQTTKSEELENHQRTDSLRDALQKISNDTRHHFIPYFIASRMGLWNPQQGITGVRAGFEAKRASILQETTYLGITAPRGMVQEELRQLLTSAKRRFPRLDVEKALYGQHRAPFDTLRDLTERERVIYAKSWQGLLGQKVPRFDNRILAPCALIPRMHVARADYDKNPLHSELHLLLALHRLRPLDLNLRQTRSLRPAELRRIFEEHLLGKGRKSGKVTFKFTPTQLEKALSEFRLVPAPNGNEIPMPKNAGRSRFSRPGAYLLKQLILSGKSPKEFLEQILTYPCAPNAKTSIQENLDPRRGLIRSDLKWLDILRDQNWEGIYVPDTNISERSSTSQILADLRNPVVRHRVEFFEKTFRELRMWSEKALGRAEPDRVVIELVREKLNEKKKTEREKFNRERRKERDAAYEELKGAKRTQGDQLLRKFMMAKAQGWINLFPSSGDARQKDERLNQKDLSGYEIEHILPRSKGGPDAFWNLVLCPTEINREKRECTPRDWLAPYPDRWAIFVKRVQMAKDLHPKTRQLLLASQEEAREISDKYTQLAGTAWIARLVRRVIFSAMDWPENQISGQRVVFVNGHLTAKLRRVYGLNSLLRSEDDHEDKKNRESPLHDALDACVVSFVDNQINPALTPRSVASIKEMIFSTQLINAGPRAALLEENFYGKRTAILENDTFEASIWKVPVPMLALKSFNMKQIFKIEQLEGNIKRIYPTPTMQADLPVRDTLIKILEKLRFSKNPEEDWAKWCRAHLTNGTFRRVTLYERIPVGLSEFKSVPIRERGTKNIPPQPAFQLLKPKGTHLGQFVVSGKDKQGEIRVEVRPLYVHEVRTAVEKEILSRGQRIEFFVRSGDFMILPNGTPDGKIVPGTYRLNSLWANGPVALSDLKGRPLKNKPTIARLFELGLRPIKII